MLLNKFKPHSFEGEIELSKTVKTSPDLQSEELKSKYTNYQHYRATSSVDSQHSSLYKQKDRNLNLNKSKRNFKNSLF